MECPGRLTVRATLVACLLAAMPALLMADLAWPSDFWTQVTNSMALPSGTQIASATASMAVAKSAGNSIAGDDLGTSERPFDSRWRTYGISDTSWLDTGPLGCVIIFR